MTSATLPSGLEGDPRTVVKHCLRGGSKVHESLMPLGHVENEVLVLLLRQRPHVSQEGEGGREMRNYSIFFRFRQYCLTENRFVTEKTDIENEALVLLRVFR